MLVALSEKIQKIIIIKKKEYQVTSRMMSYVCHHHMDGAQCFIGVYSVHCHSKIDSHLPNVKDVCSL